VAADAPVRLNGRRSLRRRLWRELLLRISRAQSRVWITVPYFVPTSDLLRALELAARKADVRILLPQTNDIPFMPWIAGLYVARLQRAGIRIWAYPRMVHAKTEIIDDLGLVGSSNLNSRSLIHDLEADVWLSAPTSLETLTNTFLADCATSQLVASGSQFAWWKRWLGSTILLMQRWL
jgi:cardiolipin synthase